MTCLEMEEGIQAKDVNALHFGKNKWPTEKHYSLFSPSATEGLRVPFRAAKKRYKD